MHGDVICRVCLCTGDTPDGMDNGFSFGNEYGDADTPPARPRLG